MTEDEDLQRVADAYEAKYAWPPTVVDGAFDAPSPDQVYVIAPSVV